MTGRRARAGGLLALALLAGLLGCGRPEPELAWSRVEVPDGVTPLLLVAVADDLLVAGAAEDLPTPRVLRLDGDGGLDPVPVTADSYYGVRALWFDAAVRGEEVVAIGRQSGGAHGNPRWTTWEGGAAGVVEQPEQPLSVFGGWGAGGLAGITLTADGPVIVGTRTGEVPGLDIRLWLPDGDDWVEQPSAGTALAASDDVRPVATDVVVDGDALLITGLVQSDDGRVAAAVWRAPGPAGPWQRVDLPAEGRVVSAQDALCDAGRCLVVGRADGGVAAWWVEGAEVSPTTLPEVPPGRTTDDVPAPVLWQGTFAVVLPNGEDGLVAVSEDDGWRTLPGPPGRPVAAAAAHGALHVVTEDGGLWSAQR